MDKKALSESDICDKYIRPAMQAAGWHGLDQIYREFPLRAGRVVVRGSQTCRDTTCIAQLRRLCVDLRQRLTTAEFTQSHLAQAFVSQVA